LPIRKRKQEEHFRPGFDKQGNRTDARGKMISWFVELTKRTKLKSKPGSFARLLSAPWKNLQALSRSEFTTSVRELTEEQYRKLRWLVFLQWSEMDYGFSCATLISVLREFLGTIGKIDDKTMFSK
jgi:hypothetical protein